MRNTRSIIPALRIAIAASSAITASALARSPRESVTFTGVNSDGLLNSPANGIRTNTFVGGYPLGRVTFSGTLTSINPHTWRSDSCILITLPGGATATYQPFTSGTTFTSLTFSGSLYVNAGADPVGLWNFRFYENFDDGGPGVVDAQWTVTVTLTDDAPPAPSSNNLGTMLTPGQTVSSVSLSNGQILWYKFTLPWGVHSGLHTYLDIDTFGSSITANAGSGFYPNDTVIALYDSSGNLVALDDDSGPGTTSQLSFGAGPRPARSGGQPYDGRNGPLTAGIYYLAIGGFRMSANSQYWGVTPVDFRNGTVAINFGTNLTTTAPVCYANCDASTVPPVLTANDFQCFLNRYAAGDSYANCDGSTVPPTLNANDFQCFLNAYAAGCP
jgi:hypothetical protein